MLKIVKAFEPIQVKTIITCVYAQPGIGRTTLGYSADTPLLLDFDQAAHRAKNRGDTVLINSWADVEKMDAADFAPYKTVVVDTVGRALDHMTVKIIEGNAKAGNKAGGLSLQGYGELKTTFTSWMNKLRSFGLDVVLLAHMDEQTAGDGKVERIDIQGGSKNEVYKVSDLMGRFYMDNGQRVLNFSPTDVAFGKNPAQLDPFKVPHYSTMGAFLAGIIKATKDAINKLSAEQQEVTGLLAEWQAKVDGAAVVADFNGLIPACKDLDARIVDNAKRVLVAAARGKGFTFDARAVAFKDAAPAPAGNGNGAATAGANGTNGAHANGTAAANGNGAAPANGAQQTTAAEPAKAETKRGRAAKKEEPQALPPADPSEAGSNG